MYILQSLLNIKGLIARLEHLKEFRARDNFNFCKFTIRILGILFVILIVNIIQFTIFVCLLRSQYFGLNSGFKQLRTARLK